MPAALDAVKPEMAGVCDTRKAGDEQHLMKGGLAGQPVGVVVTVAGLVGHEFTNPASVLTAISRTGGAYAQLSTTDPSQSGNRTKQIREV